MEIQEIWWKVVGLVRWNDGSGKREKLGRENSKKKEEKSGGKRMEKGMLES